MSAKTPLQRQQEKRERDKLSEADRLSRLLSRRIELELFKSTDAALIRIMARTGITEPQDVITRLIHSADQMTDSGLARLTELRK